MKHGELLSIPRDRSRCRIWTLVDIILPEPYIQALYMETHEEEGPMARFKPEQAEKDAVSMVAALMAASARTAPKARGVDATDSLILDGDDLEELAAAMERKGKGKSPYWSSVFTRDANNVRNSSAVLLIGVKGLAYPFLSRCFGVSGVVW